MSHQANLVPEKVGPRVRDVAVQAPAGLGPHGCSVCCKVRETDAACGPRLMADGFFGVEPSREGRFLLTELGESYIGVCYLLRSCQMQDMGVKEVGLIYHLGCQLLV
jgi:hypothetical protein